eukprot:85455-Prorocentrum_minimum.AAC.2
MVTSYGCAGHVIRGRARSLAITYGHLKESLSGVCTFISVNLRMLACAYVERGEGRLRAHIAAHHQPELLSVKVLRKLV